MSRTCTICTHPQREKIDHALLAEESFRSIAERFGVSATALLRHKEDHIPAHLAQSKEAEEVARADNLTAELRRIMARVNLLFDACDRYLRDPENPEQYDIGPRAEDIKVTYLEPVDDDKVVRRKARLSELLPKVEQQGLMVTLIEVKHADPRELILKTSQRLEGQLELLARLVGELQDGQTVNVLIMPEWHRVRAVIVEALASFPPARVVVAEALWRLEHANGSA
jgi:hypothetical protein